jgi:uncharacterized protein (DUF1501 family)
MKKVDRREFIKLSAITAGAILSPFGLQELNADTIEAKDYKAIVCIMLSGGNDSYNMLVPTDDKRYSEYQDSRSNLALDKSKLYPLGYKEPYGLHQAMPKCATLFKSKNLSFVANIGPLVRPTTKADYFGASVELPLGLMSHADQLRHWLTSIPQGRVDYGIAGRIADLVAPNNKNQDISMNISLSGPNYFQSGLVSKEYAITKEGSVGLNINEKRNLLDKSLYKNFNNLLNREYEGDFKQTYLDILKEAQNAHEGYRSATEDVSFSTSFSKSDLSIELKEVAKAIASAKRLGMKRQTFYVMYHGWDHHDELLNSHAKMLGVLDNAMYEFNLALKEIGASDSVLTFTASDFARSLTSNGNGTDHAWGGNSMIMGDMVVGAEIFGEYPSLRLGSELDIGGGVLIPTTSTDELYAQILRWYGIKEKKISQILPNLKNFSHKEPLGFIKGDKS